MRKDIIIQVNSETNAIVTSSKNVGISSENLQGKIIFRPEPFVDGFCRMYVGTKGSIEMDKQDNCYTLDIKSSLLKTPGIDVCFKITEPENESGIPIFATKIIYFNILDTIEDDAEIPDEYPTWIETFDSKIAEIQKLEETIEQAETERNKKVDNAVENIKDLTEKYNENAKKKTEEFNKTVEDKTETEIKKYDEETDKIIKAKKDVLDDYEKDKESELDEYTKTIKKDLDSYEEDKKKALDDHTDDKKSEIDSYITEQEKGLKKELDDYTSDKAKELDEHKEALEEEMSDTKDTLVQEFNDNVEQKTTDFNNNAVAKTDEFNDNAENVMKANEKLKAVIESELEQVTTEKATSIDIDDSAKWYSKLIPFGRTEQTQYTGKNLFSGDFLQFDNVGGTGSTYAYFALPDNTKTYTLTLIAKNDFTPATYTYIGFTKNGGNASGSYKWAVDPNKGTIARGTVISISSSSNFSFVSLYTKDEATLKIFTDNFDVQLEEGSIFTDYEPYVGGYPSPNPQYPQKIQNVEGRACKNLFDKNNVNKINAVINTSNNTLNESQNGKCLYIKCNPNETYTVSKKASERFIVGTSIYTPTIGTSIINPRTNNTGSSITITTSNVSEYLVVYYYLTGTDTITEQEILDSLQIEKGSLPTSYEEYYQGKAISYKTCNKNLFPGWLMDIRYDADTGAPVVTSAIASNIIEVDFEKFPSYYLSGLAEDTSNTYLTAYDKDKNYIGRTSSNPITEKEITKNIFNVKGQGTGDINAIKYIAINHFNYNTGTPILEVGSTKADYVPHQEQTITFPLKEGQKLMEGDYLADDGIHHVENQIIELYTAAQQEAYNRLQNVMLEQGVNHIWTETEDGLKPNLQLTYRKSGLLDRQAMRKEIDELKALVIAEEQEREMLEEVEEVETDETEEEANDTEEMVVK